MSYIFGLTNCNNIQNATIMISKNELNIKYGMNGTGKSTISKAIELFALNGDIDDELRSYGCNEASNVSCSCEVNNVVVFNENYINTLVFDRNEVIKDSFNVFIKSPNYDERMNQLNNRLKNLKIDLLGREEVQKLIGTFDSVTSKLVLTANNELRRNPFFKSVVTEKNLFKIPPKLNKYTSFLVDNPKNVEWIDWKTKGHSFDEICGCPFCAENLADDYVEEKQVFSSTFKKATANNLKEMLSYFAELKVYIVEDKYEYLVKCIREIEDTETVEFELRKFTEELNYLKEKFSNISQFDSFSIKQSDISKLDEILTSLLISKESLNIFISNNMCELLESINEKISNIKEQVTELKTEVGQVRGYIQSTVQKYKRDINDFLKSAGIKYEVDIKVNGENDAVTSLHYVGNDGGLNQVESIKKRLSWGEKNAFALVLFMFHAISQNPEIIILDDPISSFDSNKKYAIINRLFANSRQDSLYNKTVLMFTHDFEPVIDFIINKKPTGGYVNANFIKNNNGTIVEKPIEKNRGFESYIRMLIKHSKNNSINHISRLVFLRQLIEHTGTSNVENYAYNIISSLVHGEKDPMIKDIDSEKRLATDVECQAVSEFIQTYVQDFEYDEFYAQYFNVEYLASLYESLDNNYLKLQIFRAYIDIAKCRDKLKDDIILKFIDEIYHIENDYIYYLDIIEYDIVPDYIINKCNEFFEMSVDARILV